MKIPFSTRFPICLDIKFLSQYLLKFEFQVRDSDEDIQAALKAAGLV